MQLDKLDMSDPATVAAVVAIGVLLLGMCVQLVFLFSTLLKSDAAPVRKSTRQRRTSTRLDGHVTPTKRATTRGRDETTARGGGRGVAHERRREHGFHASAARCAETLVIVVSARSWTRKSQILALDSLLAKAHHALLVRKN